MKGFGWWTVALAMMLSTGSAGAGDRFGAGVKLGTYGLGAEFGVAVNDHLGFRLSLNRIDPTITETYDDVEYDGDFSVGGEGLLVDVYPMGGQFRLSLGVFNNRNGVSLAGTPQGPVTIGNTTYPAATVGTLSGDIDFDGTVPYLGLGWGNVARGKNFLRFLVELGVVQQGSGRIENLTSSTGLVSQQDLNAEAAKIEDEISDYDLWPIISFGIGFRF